MKIKLIVISASMCMLMCGCNGGLEPMQTLPPARTEAKTSSTYTGTTVDYIYMSTAPTRRAPSSQWDMPELPDFPEFPEMDIETIEDPFGDEFEELFDNAPVVTFPSETAAEESVAQETVTVSVNTEEPQYETAVIDNIPVVLPESETAQSDTSDTSDNVIYTGEMPDTDNIETPYPFDINEYLPSPEDVPVFGTMPEYPKADFYY